MFENVNKDEIMLFLNEFKSSLKKSNTTLTSVIRADHLVEMLMWNMPVSEENDATMKSLYGGIQGTSNLRNRNFDLFEFQLFTRHCYYVYNNGLPIVVYLSPYDRGSIEIKAFSKIKRVPLNRNTLENLYKVIIEIGKVPTDNVNYLIRKYVFNDFTSTIYYKVTDNNELYLSDMQHIRDYLYKVASILGLQATKFYAIDEKVGRSSVFDLEALALVTTNKRGINIGISREEGTAVLYITEPSISKKQKPKAVRCNLDNKLYDKLIKLR